MEAAATIDVLGREELLSVLSYLSKEDIQNAACVQRSWREASLDDMLWKKFLRTDFLQAECKLPPVGGEDGESVDSYQEAYRAWSERYGKYGELYPRARRCWDTIEGFLSEEFPECLASLRPGATEEELALAEAELVEGGVPEGLEIPPGLRSLYAIHDGQDLKFDDDAEQGKQQPHPSMFWGLLGGYVFYHHAVSTRLLSLRRMIKWNANLRSRGIIKAGSPVVLFAASYQFQKLFFIDMATGRVCASRERVQSMMPAGPAGGDGQDSALRWMEAYAAKLESRVLRVEALDPGNPMTRGICLFASPPAAVVADTRGIRVEASAVLVPEHCHDSGGGKHSFAYSIRVSMPVVTEGGGAAGSLQRAQLMGRHWRILGPDGTLASEVRGEGVIGKYPIVTPGMEVFVYQSCTSQEAKEGSMEGTFQFVEGTINVPAGAQFEVVVPRFRLDVPDVVH